MENEHTRLRAASIRLGTALGGKGNHGTLPLDSRCGRDKEADQADQEVHLLGWNLSRSRSWSRTRQRQS